MTASWQKQVAFKLGDFEAAVQLACATTMNLDAVITRNRQDVYLKIIFNCQGLTKYALPVVSAGEFIKSLSTNNQQMPDFELLISLEEEVEREDFLFLEVSTEDDDGKPGKVGSNRQKHYTEDSIHLYLQEIGRIRLLQADEEIELARKIADLLELEIEKLRFIAKSAQLPISLETRIGKEEDSRLGDFIESYSETPEDQVSKNLLREDLESVLDTLSPRERDVLRLHYGLDDGHMKSLEEIGHIFNVTRERIRQIEAKALRKLRIPILKEYIR